MIVGLLKNGLFPTLDIGGSLNGIGKVSSDLLFTDTTANGAFSAISAARINGGLANIVAVGEDIAEPPFHRCFAGNPSACEKEQISFLMANDSGEGVGKTESWCEPQFQSWR